MNDLLSTLLRPAGGGLYLVSTGKSSQIALQKKLYEAATEDEIDARWRGALARLGQAKVALVGVPSDVGAGYLRGANLGPQAIRERLVENPTFKRLMADGSVVDAGDVFVVPQLLHDDMLSSSQLEASRRALYPRVSAEERAALPVSPLSIAERAYDELFRIAPRIKPFVLGGDHSNAWPVSVSLARSRKVPWAIVQIDAHTDLLEERLGVRYCFATWSFHASRLFDRPDKLVQLGTRASRFPREHWEKTVGVRQFWAVECNSSPDSVIDDVTAHLERLGVKEVYFSNDIDGTDEAHGDATGTPEPFGLEPEFVLRLIERLATKFDLCAGDVMEVAPPIERTPGGKERTLALAERYVIATLEQMVKG